MFNKCIIILNITSNYEYIQQVSVDNYYGEDIYENHQPQNNSSEKYHVYFQKLVY